MKTDIEKIQEKSKSVLFALLHIFEKYNLTYFLARGSFLGAVRHNGCIPWDDDIDISMPRDSYEKFLSVIDELPENLQVRNFKTDPEYRYFITRVLDKTMKVVDLRSKEITHPAVDIFPLDGSPNNIIARKVYFFRMMFLRILLSMANRDVIDENRKRNIFERVLVSIIVRTPFEKILSEERLKYTLEKRMKSYSYESSEYVGCLMGAYRLTEMMPKSWYSDGKEYSFESSLVIGPSNDSSYLTHLYGDYMQIPDEESIQSKIHYQIYSEDS